MTVPLLELAETLKAGRLSPASVAATDLARIEEIDRDLKACLPEPGRAGRVMAEAKAIEKRWPEPAKRPPLFGIPVGVKDLFRVDGLPTRAGSALPEKEFVGAEASIVTRLREMGALILAKTATDEFAYADPPETRNPRDAKRTPGGSSAGSAAGVAAGLFPLGIGTQTSRSIVAPAAFCGVVGVKPSHGRIPLDGVFPLAPSMDTVGFLTEDVAGARLAAGALIGNWKTPQPRRPVFGIPAGAYLAGIDDLGWRPVFDSAVANLRREFKVVDVDLGWDARLDDIYKDAMTLLHGEFAASHAALFARHGPLYRQMSRGGVTRGNGVSAQEIRRTREAGLALRREIGQALRASGADVLLSPSQPGPAPLLGERTGWGSPTAPWSYAGLPCVSIPCGRAGALPLGLQLVASFGEDEFLLEAAALAEKMPG